MYSSSKSQCFSDRYIPPSWFSISIDEIHCFLFEALPCFPYIRTSLVFAWLPTSFLSSNTFSHPMVFSQGLGFSTSAFYFFVNKINIFTMFSHKSYLLHFIIWKSDFWILFLLFPFSILYIVKDVTLRNIDWLKVIPITLTKFCKMCLLRESIPHFGDKISKQMEEIMNPHQPKKRSIVIWAGCEICLLFYRWTGRGSKHSWVFLCTIFYRPFITLLLFHAHIGKVKPMLVYLLRECFRSTFILLLWCR